MKEKKETNKRTNNMKTNETKKCNHARNSPIVRQTEGKYDLEGPIWTQRCFSFPNRCIRMATSFSGIGAPETALERLGLRIKQVFACDMGERELKETYKTHRKLIMELPEDKKEVYAMTLYNDNKDSINKDREAVAKKTGQSMYSPFTLEEVHRYLFGDIIDSKLKLQITENCMKILMDHKKKVTNEEKEMFIRELYDDKGINFVKESFFANHEIEEKDWYTDICFLDATKYKGQVDLYVGGSPCQSYSIAGKRYGLNENKGTLFYHFARIIKECEPKVFIYENVPGMMTCGKGKISGLEFAIKAFHKDLGYHVYWKVLNACDYNVPQNRERIWVVGFKEKTDFLFPAPVLLTKCIEDYLDIDTFDKNGNVLDINGKISGPIVRNLRASEALRLMGFTSFKIPSVLQNPTISDQKRERILISHAGNSMVVECLMALYKQMDITRFGE